MFFLYEYRSRLNERELKMTEKSSFSIFLGKSIGISALLLGFLNICGMFISFFHLRRFGIFEISFFQIQYIFVGFIFVLILIAPILIFIVLAAIAEKKTNTLSKILELSIVGLLAAITFIYILLFFFYGDFEWNWILTRFGQVIKFGNIIWLLYAWLFYATGKSLIDDLTKIKRKEILPSRELWIPTVFLLTLFILFFTYYANIVHLNIHASLGGGKPIPAEILIAEEGLSSVKLLGLTPDTTQKIRDISIIHETSAMIYVIPSNQENVKSLAISKNFIQGIRFLSEQSKQ